MDTHNIPDATVYLPQDLNDNVQPKKKSKRNKEIIGEECIPFLDGQCNDQKCQRIHNFSKMFRIIHNTEFVENYNILSNDIKLLGDFENQKNENDIFRSMLNPNKSDIIHQIFFIFKNKNDSEYFDLSDDLMKIISDHFTRNININIPFEAGGGNRKYNLKKLALEDNEEFFNEKVGLFSYSFYTTEILCMQKFLKKAKDTGYKVKVEFDDVFTLTNDNFSKFYSIRILDYGANLYNFLYSSFHELSSPLKNNNGKPIYFITCRNLNIFTENLNLSYSTLKCLKTSMESLSVSVSKALETHTSISTNQSECNWNCKISFEVSSAITRIMSSIREEQQPFTSDLECTVDFFCEEDTSFWENNDSSPEFSCICHAWFIRKDRNVYFSWKTPIIGTSRISSRVKLSKFPFSKGSMRYAFFMYDTFLNQKLVGKIPFNITNLSISSYENDIKTIVYCRLIADIFNNRIINYVSDMKLLINFVDSYVYEILQDIPIKFYSVENYIEGEYEKYNNNSGWINDTTQHDKMLIAQTFSHFSWQLTAGYLMIVDLQGVGTFLTDPQIHCMDNNKFGKGNLSYYGMLKFFSTHNCNEFCFQLGLKHPNTVDVINISQFDFFVENYSKPNKPNEAIMTVCELCKCAYQSPAIKFYESKVFSTYIFCKHCQKKINETMKSRVCAVCSKRFFSSEYWYKMKRTDFPIRCRKCRVNMRIKNNK